MSRFFVISIAALLCILNNAAAQKFSGGPGDGYESKVTLNSPLDGVAALPSGTGKFAGGIGDGFHNRSSSSVSLNEVEAPQIMAAVVPTLTEWGIIVLVLWLAGAALIRVRRMRLEGTVT